MEVILLSEKNRRHACVQLSGLTTKWVLACTALLLVLLCLSGFYLGQERTVVRHEARLNTLQQEFLVQQRLVAEAIETAEQDLTTLGAKLGRMQAHVTRLDAVGERLVGRFALDADEFAFGREPPLGGPEVAAETAVHQDADFVQALNQLAARLESMRPRLDGLEALLRDRSVASDLQPSGWPLERGWVSSRFGNRTDPITGRPVFHGGVDFAAKAGTEVVAVASGIVTWAGQREGYGDLVEISHGDGYTTRYAHNERHLVQAGAKVDKGQPIALLGATGRSTGPHLHFEVLRNGKPLNPMRFVRELQ